MSENSSLKYEVAVGDVHGCGPQLGQLIDKIYEFTDGTPMQAIMLGDYVDRGPESRQVIEFLIENQGPSLICLRGNHEQMMIDAYRKRKMSDVHLWLMNGGQQTLQSYGGDDFTCIPESHIEWMESLPLFHETEHRIYVHAGLDPRRPQERDPNTLMWIRDAFLRSKYEWPKHVVHGHTPHEEPELLLNRTNLDTGCFHYNVLTAAVFDNAVPGGPIKVIQNV